VIDYMSQCHEQGIATRRPYIAIERACGVGSPANRPSRSRALHAVLEHGDGVPSVRLSHGSRRQHRMKAV